MISVKLHSLQNATATAQEFATQAVDLLQGIINDPRFLEEVRNTNYTYTARMLDSGETAASTDSETIAEIISGGRELRREPNGTIDLTVQLRRFSIFYAKTMGAVTPPHPLISTNTRFFDPWLRQQRTLTLAAHWMHEWMHVAGFYHASSSGDIMDVPYAVGEIVVRLGARSTAESGLKSFGAADTGAEYRAAAKGHECVVSTSGLPADLFEDSGSEP